MPLAADALVSIDEAEAWLPNLNANATRLELAINGASRAIRRYIKRQILPRETAATKKFRYAGGGSLPLYRTELSAAPTAVVLFSDLPAADQVTLAAATGTTEADYRLEPRRGTLESTYLELLLPRLEAAQLPTAYGSSGYSTDPEDRGAEVAVTGNWGACADLTTVPGDIKEACLIAVKARLMNPGGMQSVSMGGISVSEPLLGDGVDLGLPLGAIKMLVDYRRDAYI